jgi:hypothetical protein
MGLWRLEEAVCIDGLVPAAHKAVQGLLERHLYFWKME